MVVLKTRLGPWAGRIRQRGKWKVWATPWVSDQQSWSCKPPVSENSLPALHAFIFPLHSCRYCGNQLQVPMTQGLLASAVSLVSSHSVQGCVCYLMVPQQGPGSLHKLGKQLLLLCSLGLAIQRGDSVIPHPCVVFPAFPVPLSLGSCSLGSLPALKPMFFWGNLDYGKSIPKVKLKQWQKTQTWVRSQGMKTPDHKKEQRDRNQPHSTSCAASTLGLKNEGMQTSRVVLCSPFNPWAGKLSVAAWVRTKTLAEKFHRDII